MKENAIKTWNNRKKAMKPRRRKKFKKTSVPEVVIIRQDRVASLLDNAGVNKARELDQPKDLFAVRALQLGAVL